MTTYKDKLDPACLARYNEKLKFCNNIDPYSIDKSCWSGNVEEFPDITYPDIVNYLISSQCPYTLDDLKSYKSLESYNYFVSGWVSEIGMQKLPSRLSLLIAKVKHSQRMNEPSLKPWVIAEINGKILCAHCNCMAGLGESCSHIGALLFALEAVVKIRNAKTVTQDKAYWLLPSSVNKVKYETVQEIDFTSARTKKRKLDQSLNLTSTPPSVTKSRKDLPYVTPPTDLEIQNTFDQLHRTGKKPVILSLVDRYAENYIPKVLGSNFPLILPEVRDENYFTVQKPELFKRCKEIFQTLTVTDAEATNVETATKLQSQSRDWFRFRAGRITASVMKSVCHSDPEDPSQSLVKRICYPENYQFKTEATEWGSKHEIDAKKVYCTEMAEHHQNFCFKTPGLILSTNHPHLGASPDGVSSCDCCGESIVEIKCPFNMKDKYIVDICNNKSFLCFENNKITLKHNHEYYYQVQTQLMVSGKQFCDFVVWTQTDFHKERISKNEDFCRYILNASQKFFVTAVLPELVGKFYSRPESCQSSVDKTKGERCDQQTINESLKPIDKDRVICICKTPYAPSGDNVIQCSNPQCPYSWFHFKCIKMKKVPKRKWFCPACKASKSS